MARYLSGLCVAGLGLCAGGWLIITAVLLSREPTEASLVSLSTGAGLAVVSAVGIACWSVAWRQRMRRDGVLAYAGCPVAGERPAPAGSSALAGSLVPAGESAPAGRSAPAGGSASPGGPVPPRKARRSARVLRRDMRRAARTARRQARRRGAASMGTIAYGGGAARRASAAQRAGGAQRTGAARPDSVIRPDSAGIEVIRAPAAVPEDPALLLLNEIRTLLEPLLAAAHDAAVPAAAQGITPGMMPEKIADGEESW
jgi:hypothetical protein